MILSDKTIREELAGGGIAIDPLDPDAVQPSSVDLRLADEFVVFATHAEAVIDVERHQPNVTEAIKMDSHQPFVLHPQEFVLGATMERIRLSSNIVGRLEGKSSLGRLGLLIHSTAGFVDAGWEGQLTLELLNVAPLPILLHPGMRVAQISFLRMTTPADRPYGDPRLGSKYQGQTGPTPSRYFENFSKPAE